MSDRAYSLRMYFRMSFETCLGSFHSVDMFQGSVITVYEAMLTPKS